MLRRDDGDEADLVWICAIWDNTRRYSWPFSSSVWICCLCWSVSGSCSCSWAGLSSPRLSRIPVLVYILVYAFIRLKISGDNLLGHPYARRLFINLLRHRVGERKRFCLGVWKGWKSIGRWGTSSLPFISTYLRSVKLSKKTRYAAYTLRSTYLSSHGIYVTWNLKQWTRTQNARTSNKLFNNLSRKQRGSLMHPQTILTESLWFTKWRNNSKALSQHHASCGGADIDPQYRQI